MRRVKPRWVRRMIVMFFVDHEAREAARELGVEIVERDSRVEG